MEAIADACDLALLTVESEAFWEGVPDLPFSTELARPCDTVSVIGFPIGGSNLSVTQGVVSRLDLIDYSQSFLTQALLSIQIDVRTSVHRCRQCWGASWPTIGSARPLIHLGSARPTNRRRSTPATAAGP